MSKKLLRVVCKRKSHTFATVVEEDGVMWLDMPRFGAHPQNDWQGTPRRVQLPRIGQYLTIGTSHSVGCACRKSALLSQQKVLDELENGDGTPMVF